MDCFPTDPRIIRGRVYLLHHFVKQKGNQLLALCLEFQSDNYDQKERGTKLGNSCSLLIQILTPPTPSQNTPTHNNTTTNNKTNKNPRKHKILRFSSSIWVSARNLVCQIFAMPTGTAQNSVSRFLPCLYAQHRT